MAMRGESTKTQVVSKFFFYKNLHRGINSREILSRKVEQLSVVAETQISSDSEPWTASYSLALSSCPWSQWSKKWRTAHGTGSGRLLEWKSELLSMVLNSFLYYI